MYCTGDYQEHWMAQVVLVLKPLNHFTSTQLLHLTLWKTLRYLLAIVLSFSINIQSPMQSTSNPPYIQIMKFLRLPRKVALNEKKVVGLDLLFLIASRNLATFSDQAKKSLGMKNTVYLNIRYSDRSKCECCIYSDITCATLI